jgi:hypothetical protein
MCGELANLLDQQTQKRHCVGASEEAGALPGPEGHQIRPSDDPSKVSSEAKQLIIDGCAENGYPLRNLK